MSPNIAFTLSQQHDRQLLDSLVHLHNTLVCAIWHRHGLPGKAMRACCKFAIEKAGDLLDYGNIPMRSSNEFAEVVTGIVNGDPYVRHERVLIPTGTRSD